MKTFNKIAFGLAGLFMLAGTANATVTSTEDWGVHGSYESGSLILPTAAGSFDSFYVFSLDKLYDVLSVGVSNDSTNDPKTFDISGGMVELFQDAGTVGVKDGADVSLGSFSFDSTAITHTYSGLGFGNYFYEVTGNVTGTLAGSYLLFSSITPVPEADTYAMMLAGLGLMGFMVRRRRGA
jgi:hypothetical protein